MKPNHDFVAERPLARHCAELLPAPLPQRDSLAGVSCIAQDMAVILAQSLVSVASGGDIKVVCGEASRSSTTGFINRMGRGMEHCVIGTEGGAGLLMSIGAQAVHVLTDRAYGGSGEVPEVIPADLPLSADLTLRQIEGIWRDAIGSGLAASSDIAVMRRGHDLGRLDPFRGQAECVVCEFAVEQEGQESWNFWLAVSVRDVDRLIDLRAVSDDRVSPAIDGAKEARDLLAAPLGDIPLPVRAVLSETSISLSRASSLAAGTIIPLAIAREVPLLIGDRVIARGTIGTQDDCVALQIIQNS